MRIIQTAFWKILGLTLDSYKKNMNISFEIDIKIELLQKIIFPLIPIFEYIHNIKNIAMTPSLGRMTK